MTEGIVRFPSSRAGWRRSTSPAPRQLSTRFLEQRIRLGAGPPLNVNDLQDRLQLLLQDPTIAKLDARLLPGSAPGQARLAVAVEEREKRFSVEARAANDQSPSIGANDVGLTFTWFNVLGRNDPLVLTGDLTEGLREASFYYSVPLTARDLRFHILGQISSADVVDDDVEDLNIESSAKQLTVGFGMPIIDTTANRVGLDLSFNRERNRTYLLNEPFSFSPGTDDGRSDVSVLQFTQDWQNRGRRRAISMASTFNLGLPILGATDNGNEQPDGEFFYWLGQGQLAHRLFSDRDQVVVRGQAQIATDPLLASQQYSLGGIDTVRGYFVNEVVRDSGFAVGIEYRYPLLDLWDRERIRGPDDMSLELVPFFDYGYGVNHSRQPRGRRFRHAGQPRPGPALDLAAAAAGGGLLGQPLQQPRRLARRRPARRRHQFPDRRAALLTRRHLRRRVGHAGVLAFPAVRAVQASCRLASWGWGAKGELDLRTVRALVSTG